MERMYVSWFLSSWIESARATAVCSNKLLINNLEYFSDYLFLKWSSSGVLFWIHIYNDQRGWKPEESDLGNSV